MTPALPSPLPKKDCALCPRLVAFRHENAKKVPHYFNAPAPCFGDENAALLVVGLAPGLHGANKTGRPFTGDDAGKLLYDTLEKFDFTSGTYRPDGKDDFHLHNCLITNAVRCVPPQNKPIGAEINQCRDFLSARLATQKKKGLRAVLAIGGVAHSSILRAEKIAVKTKPFKHGACYTLPDFTLYDSYHCSRYNTNTKRLTTPMFESVFARIKKDLA